jgi:hypothetical protein
MVVAIVVVAAVAAADAEVVAATWGVVVHDVDVVAYVVAMLTAAERNAVAYFEEAWRGAVHEDREHSWNET